MGYYTKQVMKFSSGVSEERAASIFRWLN